jgi:hypothetical protein
MNPSPNINFLLQRLPQVRQWIDALLLQHAAQARTVASFGFQRLGAYYPPALLENSKVVIVPEVPLPPLSDLGLGGFAEFENLDAIGITYKDTYFVIETHACDESLHFHELVHIIQWQLLGVDAFLAAYALGLMQHGYRCCPLEVMAYDLQKQFEACAPSFNVPKRIYDIMKTMPGPYARSSTASAPSRGFIAEP